MNNFSKILQTLASLLKIFLICFKKLSMLAFYWSKKKSFLFLVLLKKRIKKMKNLQTLVSFFDFALNVHYKSFIKRLISLCFSAICLYFLCYTWKGFSNGCFFLVSDSLFSIFGIHLRDNNWMFQLSPEIPTEAMMPCFEQILFFLTETKSLFDFNIFTSCFFVLFFLCFFHFRERKPMSFLEIIFFIFYYLYYGSDVALFFFSWTSEIAELFSTPLGFFTYFLWFFNISFFPFVVYVLLKDKNLKFFLKIGLISFFYFWFCWSTCFSALSQMYLLTLNNLLTNPSFSEFFYNFFLESYGFPIANCMNEERYLATQFCQEQKEAMESSCSRAKSLGKVKLGGGGPVPVKAAGSAVKLGAVYDCSSKIQAFQECVEKMMEMVKKAKK